MSYWKGKEKHNKICSVTRKAALEGSEGILSEDAEASNEDDSESSTKVPPATSCLNMEVALAKDRTKVNHRRAASEELRFLCRMECISKMKNNIESKQTLLLDDTEAFKADLEKLKELWNQVTLEDLEFASRSTGRHLGKLFDMLTVHVPRVSVELEEPILGSGKKVHKLVRELPQDSILQRAILGKKRFFPYRTDYDADGIEGMWSQHVNDGFADRHFSAKEWPVQVLVDVAGVGLMKSEEYADLVIMMVLSKFSGYATSAHALLFMCWKKQTLYYWMNVAAACASILALIHITFCTKVLGCSEALGRNDCCTDSGFYHTFGPIVVLCVGLWFLITDIIYAFILLRETNYAKSVLWSSKVFEFLLEAITTVIAAKMALHGWTFAREKYIQYFLVVSCRWLHLIYILIPLPIVGRTVLPMFQAVFSYESRAFLCVNLVMLVGSFQAYISLRSDINAEAYKDGLAQQMGDALMAQYRLNFLGDFSTDELRGESLELKDNVISTQVTNSERRQGLVVFMVFVTFIQAVLMLNLYIGILGDSYSSYKESIDTGFMQFRANFMLKNLCVVRFLNKYFGLQGFNSYLACFEEFSRADVLWAIYPYEADSGEVPPDLCQELKDEIGKQSDLKSLMGKLGT